MEIKNTTSYTFNVLWEFNHQHRKTARRVTNILLAVVGPLALLAMILMAVRFILDRTDLPDLLLVAACLYCVNGAVNRLFLFPRRVRLILYRRSNQKMVTDYLFTEKGFEQSTITTLYKEQQQCSYEVLVNVVESDHAFYLYVNQGTAHIVSKDGFTEGTEQDFRNLLRTVIDPKKLRIK